MSTQYGSDSTAAQSESTEKQYIQPCFFTSTLMFRLLPMVTFNIQYFTLSLAIETCGELCAMVHRQQTHNAALKAAVVSQQGDTFTLLGYSEFVLPAGTKRKT